MSNEDDRDDTSTTRSDGQQGAPRVTRLFPRGHRRDTSDGHGGASGDVSDADGQSIDIERVLGDGETEVVLPPMKKGVGRPKKPRAQLPDDDPFLLIDSLDAAGAIAGKRLRMPVAVAAAFRIYCAMAPSLRTIVALHKRLEREWERAPTRATLDNWASRYGWDALLREYDLNLARWRFAHSEADRREADQRQAQAGRAMQQLAGNQIMRIVREANNYRPYVLGPDGEVLRDGRGNPVKAPKPSLSGMQGLALLYKIAVETERVALGAPTQVTSATVQGAFGITGETTTTHVVMTLDEWRKQTAADRASVQGVQGTTAETPALPPPTHPSHAQGGVAGLDDATDLPDEWFAPVDGPVVDAD